MAMTFHVTEVQKALWLVGDELRGEFGPLDDGIGVILRHELAR